MNYGPASKYYDLFGSKDDIGFYKELAVRHGRKALELGVGTGRVAIELAKAKVEVWGIDSSAYMLNVARQKLRKENASVRKRVVLKLGDMRSFKLGETFPFIYIAGSTFEHCITKKDQNNCLTSVYEALEDQGTLAFDISQPNLVQPTSSWWIDRKALNKNEEVVRTIFSRRNPQTNLVSVNLFFDVYHRGELKKRYHEYGEALLSSKHDIEAMLKNVGFKLKEVYGNFDKSAYTKAGEKAVFVVTKS